MKNKKIIPRDPIIQEAFRREVNLQPQVQKDKKKYTRKVKHKQTTKEE